MVSGSGHPLFAQFHSPSQSKENLYTYHKELLMVYADEDIATSSKNLSKERCKGFQGNRVGSIGEISYSTLEAYY